MVKKPVTVGYHHFSKKGDAASFLQAILHRCDVGDEVGVLDTEVLHRCARAPSGCHCISC